MADPISKIRGMTPEVEAKLEAEGIKNTQQLLERAKTEKERAALAHIAGTTPHVIKEFANRADLMRLKGVGGDLSNLLEEAGINTCRELQHRKPENLHKTLVELHGRKKIGHHVPSAEQVAAWITEAKGFAQTSPQ